MKRIVALLVVLLLAFYVAWPGWTAWQISSAIKAKDPATLDRKIDFPSVRLTLRPSVELKIGEIYDRVQQNVGPGAAVIIAGIKKDVIPKLAETALTNLVTPANLIRVVNDGGNLRENAEQILREQMQKTGLPGLGGAGGQPTGGGPQAGGRPNLPGGLGQVIGQIGGRLGLDTRQLPGLGGTPPGGQGEGTASAGKPAEPPVEPASAPASGSGTAAAEPKEKLSLANVKRFSFLGPLGFEIGIAKDKTTNEPDVLIEMRFVGGDWRVTGARPWKI